MKIYQKINIQNIDNKSNVNSKCVAPASIKSGNNNTPILLNSYNKYLVNFKGGLSNAMNKIPFRNTDTIRCLTTKECYKKSNGIVGNLPHEWVEKISHGERAEKIKNFYTDFEHAVITMKEEKNIVNFAENLKNAFLNAGLVAEDEKLEIKLLSGESHDDPLGGVWGNGYQIRGVFDNKYMIKVFHSSERYDWEEHIQGNYIELNKALYWQKYAGKNTQMVRFYFGDIKGFTLNKFIDLNTPKPKRYIAPEIYGLKAFDVDNQNVANGHNKINDYQIDYGGFAVLHPCLARDKKYQSVFKKFFVALKEEKVKVEFCKGNQEKIAKIKSDYTAKRADLFENYIKNASNEIKSAFVDIFPNVQDAERLMYFKTLIANAKNDLKPTLAEKLRHLSSEGRFICFKLLAEDADNPLKLTLSDKLKWIAEEKNRTECFILLAKNSDNSVKESLIRELYEISRDDRAACFKQLLIDADNNVKATFAYRLDILPIDERKLCFMLLAKNADDILKIVLADVIKLLPEKHHSDCNKLIS